MNLLGHPILSNEAALAWESGLFAGDEAKEWAAMQQAGAALAAAVVQDFAELGGFPATARLLISEYLKYIVAITRMRLEAAFA